MENRWKIWIMKENEADFHDYERAVDFLLIVIARRDKK